MRYENPVMLLAVVGHFGVVRALPVLSELPLPVQVGLALLPTVLIVLPGQLPDSWLSLRAGAALCFATGLVYLGLTLSLPVLLLVRAGMGTLPVGEAVLSALGHLLLMLPALVISLFVLEPSLEALRRHASNTAG